MLLEPILLLGDGSAISLWSLVLGGLMGGLTAGLIGIGGGAIVRPLLMSFGLAPRIATACMSVAIISNASGACTYSLKHWKADLRLGVIMGLMATIGGQAGTWTIAHLDKPALIDGIIRAAYVFLLLFLAFKLWRGKSQSHQGLRRMLFRLPFRYSSPFETEAVSPLFPGLVALFVGMVASLLGIGGGIFYVPLLMALFGRDIRELVTVSQVAVLFSSVSVASGHVFFTGNVEVRIALVLVLAGSIGTAVGSRLKKHLSARHIERLFALILLGGAWRMIVQLTGSPGPAHGKPLPAGGLQSDWLGWLPLWAAESPWRIWLLTAGFAMLAGPLLAALQHWLLDRLER